MRHLGGGNEEVCKLNLVVALLDSRVNEGSQDTSKVYVCLSVPARRPGWAQGDRLGLLGAGPASGSHTLSVSKSESGQKINLPPVSSIMGVVLNKPVTGYC